MLIVRGELLFEVDGFLLRNAASDVLQRPLERSVDKPLFDLATFAEPIGMPALECIPVLLAMVKDGWLSHDGDDFAAEQPFVQLGAARIGKQRLLRSKAELLVAKIVDAARSINRDGEEHCDYVTELAVFGSFLDSDKPELGDLDIGYATHRRKPFKKHEWKGWDDFWKRNPEKHALLRLKGRSPFVSIHTMKEIAELHVPYLIIYRLSEDLPELHAQLISQS